MADDDVGKILLLFWGESLPYLACQGDIADVGIAMGLVQHLTDKRLIHGGAFAMRVEMTSRQFDGFAYHHAECDAAYIQFVGYLERLANIVAILHKRLLGQLGVEGLHKPLTLSAAIDHHSCRLRRLSNRHTLTDTIHKRLLTKRLYDARNTNDGDAPFNPQSRIKSPARNLSPLRHTNHNLQSSIFHLQSF